VQIIHQTLKSPLLPSQSVLVHAFFQSSRIVGGIDLISNCPLLTELVEVDMVCNRYVEGGTFEDFVFGDGGLGDVQLGSEGGYFLYFLFGDWEEGWRRVTMAIKKRLGGVSRRKGAYSTVFVDSLLSRFAASHGLSLH
jgi:hypothetical protein